MSYSLVIIIILSILLLGLIVLVGYFLWKLYLRKIMAEKSRSSFKVSKELPFNVTDFINWMGTAKNIKSISATLNKVKIEYFDRSKLDLAKLEFISRNELFITSNSVTLVLGNYSTYLKEQVTNLLQN